ncbi:DMT family transporter [Desulfoferrobacter suflitae]|uniref:DMT family transporter n=1 Tax=Desulfoferrobacter suflitae TaxID=2865782 RepID=UPI0021643533|nr:DMT family transporter [Desulfoferrobacter suflitae]MCK8600833.1 DMT family transporter [Desulfoferrobacter suflitae]
MHPNTFRSDALLLLTATLWGFAFVAQRVGMEYLGPFTFNGIRFALGSLSLLPLLILTRKQARSAAQRILPEAPFKTKLTGSFLAGILLFLGASLQQIGLVYTTAGKAGFITGLYVVLVPILGLLWGQRVPTGTWLGALLAAFGLFFLSVTEKLTLELGDLLVLIGAFFWAGHVLVLGWLAPRMNSLKLALVQFSVCSLLSLVTALSIEVITLQGLIPAALPIVYGGVISVGVAYTLQVVAQRNADPAHASILLSMETVFAAVGGYLVLGETLSGRGLFGCALMLAGMLSSELSAYLFKPEPVFAERIKHANNR